MLHLLITVVVGKVTPITPPLIVHVSALAEPLSFKRIKRVCQSVGVPVTVNVVAFAIAESSYSSVISVSITAVASSVVVTTRFVIRLFVSVLVLLIVGTVTPSTDITPADTRAILVSDACHNSIDHTHSAVDVLAVIPATGNPVQFVSVPDAGVPRAGVTRVGLVALTGAHEPVAVVHTGSADAPPHTRISVVAPFASVCCAPVAVVPVAMSEYAVVPVDRHVPPSATAISVAFQVPVVIVPTDERDDRVATFV